MVGDKINTYIPPSLPSFPAQTTHSIDIFLKGQAIRFSEFCSGPDCSGLATAICSHALSIEEVLLPPESWIPSPESVGRFWKPREKR